MKTIIWRLALGFFLFGMLFSSSSTSKAQTALNCGDTIDAEFTNDPETQQYTIQLAAGDKLEILGKPFGETLTFTISVWGPSKLLVAHVGENPYYSNLSATPSAETKVLSASGTYTIMVSNGQQFVKGFEYYSVSRGDGGIGLYTLAIGCTKRDGAVIKPGENTPLTQPTATNPPLPEPLTFGFPDLAPVDFSEATIFDLPSSGQVKGKFSSKSDDVFGFTFSAIEGQQFDLTFARTSGNLNLGFVVLSSDNKVYFQTSLVASSELTTKLTLPAGKYTLGIFKIDLVTPATAETTEFALTLQ